LSDHYTTLGLSRDASQADIKKAYKNLVKKYHPDKTDSPEAHEKFKEVSEAYSVLGDEQKRAEYDNPAPQFGGFTGFDDLFSIFGRQRRGPAPTQQRPQQVRFEVPLDALLNNSASSVFGVRTENPCHDCEGKGGESTTRCNQCDGTGQITTRQSMGNMVFQQSQPCYPCGGRGHTIINACGTCSGRGHTVMNRQYRVKFNVEEI
jgi:molecular chaperone DnaJ